LRRAALAVAMLAVPACALLPASPLLAALVCGTVAFPLGMPFPCGLARLAPASVPWALAVNGCASVAAAAGAPLLATTFGITALAATGALLYALVAWGARGEDVTAAPAPAAPDSTGRLAAPRSAG
jgi:hypothetical protein